MDINPPKKKKFISTQQRLFSVTGKKTDNSLHESDDGAV